MGYDKYTSIDNHYQDKIVNRFLFGGNTDVKYQITEKLDGANFQVEITFDSIRYGKRTNYLGDEEPFFDWKNTVVNDKIDKLATTIKSKLTAGEKVQLFGELYGKGVQKRIDYGDEKHIRFFEMKVDDEYVSPNTLEATLTSVGFKHLHVPVLAVVTGLDNALAFDTEIPSMLSPTGDEIEGVVIKPLFETLYSGEKRLIFKKKNKKFSERMGVNTKDRTPKILTDGQKEFMLYINGNRMAGIVSKYGEPQSSKDIGKYISLLGQDALNDFTKDKDIELTNGKKKELSSLVGKLAIQLIKEYL